MLLGEIADFEMGQAPPSTECNFEGRGTLFVKAGEFGSPYPVEREWTTKPLKHGKVGDVFICVVGATAGKLNLGIDCAIGRSVAAIRPKSKLDTKFLYYQLLPKVLKLRASSAGSAQGVISKKQLAEIAVRVPDVAEQLQIVAEIEKQFSRLDEAVANLRRVKSNLKRYKAAVLKAAVEGRLVPTEAELARKEGRNYETGSELLKRVLDVRRRDWKGNGKYKEPATGAMEAAPRVPSGWAAATIEQLSLFVEYGSSAKTDEEPGGVPVLRMGNIFEGSFDFTKLKYLPASHREFPKLLLEQGDLLFNRTNSPELVGKSAVFNEQSRRFSFASYLIRARFVGLIDPRFVAAYLNSFYGRAWVKTVVTQQVGQANVNGRKLQALQIPLPPLAEQRAIVEEMERRLSLIRGVEVQAEANLKRAEMLRQSVLSKSFSEP